jgi:hypothetical protein
VSLLTPENLPQVLIAVGGVITAIGGITWYRVQKEPPKPGSPDAAAIALAENTKALLAMADQMDGQNRQFGDNNKLFGEVLHYVDAMARDFAEARKEMTLAREHLAALREQGNRRAR